MTISNAQLVRDFCEAWSRKDAEELGGYFTEDAVYHNIPMQPVTGKAAIREAFGMFLPSSETIEFEVINLAVAGDIVFAERVDRFLIAGKTVELPVTGVFEIEGGRIKTWRVYFDFAMWQRQMA